MRIVFVLCEGPHDVAFLSRILSSDGYVKYKNALNQYPYPLDRWFTKVSKTLSIEALNLERMYDDIKAELPSGALYNEEKNQLILLYSLNGDGRRMERRKVISTLSKLAKSPDDEKEFSWKEESSEGGNNFGLTVLFDADEKGIVQRIVEARNELSDFFPEVEGISDNGQVITVSDVIKIGIYIFADEVTATGTLEDILKPLMRQGNEPMFDDAEAFLNKHYDQNRLRPLIFKKHPEQGIVEKRDSKKKYYPIKSLMGVVGQLQNSGTSNTVCIEKTDYITLDKIKSSRICQDILSMFAKI